MADQQDKEGPDDAVTAAEDTGPSVDQAQALVDDDPQEQALDELAAYLTTQGVEVADVATIEARLDAEIGAPAEDAAEKVLASRRARGQRGPTDKSPSEETATDEDELIITISADRLSATLSRLDEHSTLRGVAAALQRDKVSYGVAVEALKKMVARARAGEQFSDVLVARGQPAIPGRDAVFAWEVETGGRAGTILEDGSIDLRDRRLVTMVAEGQLLGRYHPESSGESGRDVHGKALVPAKPHRLLVVPGTHVRAEDEADGVQALYAEVAGGIAQEQNDKGDPRKLRISMTKVSRVEGDVDYTTGHVDFDGEVIIDGSVKALFEVRASGAVTIGGNVESGARVQSGGDILIAGGVVGDETRLEAGGKVMAKFLQGCKVEAAGDVEIGAYVFEAALRIGGKLTVAGMGEGSGRALVGGVVWAAGGCETPSLGSPSNPRIRLILGVDPHRVDEAGRLRAGMRKVEEQQQQLLAELGLARFSVGAIKVLLKGTKDAAERAAHVTRVQRLTRLGETLTHARERLAVIAEEQRENARGVTLVVTGTTFPGPELRLGEHTLRIAEETHGRRFCLVEEDGKISVQVQES